MSGNEEAGTSAGRLAGLTAIVTGAASGLGSATAMAMAREGAKVVCADLNLSGTRETSAAIRNLGGTSIHAECDVRSARSTEALAALTLGEYGRIDILFANAGVPAIASATSCSLDQWDQVIAVNLTGVWLSMRAVLPAMERQGSGSIVVTSSTAGLVGVRDLAAYSAAKAGVIGLTKQVAVDYGRVGVRVNAVVPGTIQTPLVEESFRASGMAGEDDRVLDEAVARASRRFPLGRLGAPEDVAAAAVYLAGPEARWTTGSLLVVDGGFTSQ